MKLWDRIYYRLIQVRKLYLATDEQTFLATVDPKVEKSFALMLRVNFYMIKYQMCKCVYVMCTKLLQILILSKYFYSKTLVQPQVVTRLALLFI